MDVRDVEVVAGPEGGEAGAPAGAPSASGRRRSSSATGCSTTWRTPPSSCCRPPWSPSTLDSLLEAAGRSDVVTSFGYAQTIASLAVAVRRPILGSLADFQGKKIRFFLGFFLTGLVCCFGMALPLGWLAFLAVYVVATVGLNSSMTFYDA